MHILTDYFAISTYTSLFLTRESSLIVCIHRRGSDCFRFAL